MNAEVISQLKIEKYLEICIIINIANADIKCYGSLGFTPHKHVRDVGSFEIWETILSGFPQGSAPTAAFSFKSIQIT